MSYKHLFWFTWILAVITLIAFIHCKETHAQTTVSLTIPCNNMNWQTSPDCNAPVESFVVEPITGNVSGQLTSGKEFTQTWYGNLMLFKMENVCWLTNGHTTVYCDI